MKRFSDLPERWQKVIIVVCIVASGVVPLKLLDLLPIPLEYYSRAYPFRAKLVEIAISALSLALLLAPLWTDHLIGKRIERRRRQEQAAADWEERKKRIAALLEDHAALLEDHAALQEEHAGLQERVDQLQQVLEEKVKAARAGGVDEGLAQGREEGYSLGHSEGYKYALYTQNRFRYYNGDPPLTYEEARRSLDEGTDGANGELIEPEPPAPPTRAPGKKRRSRKKKPEPAPEPTTAAHEEPNDEELDRLFQEVKENYERNGFKLNTSDGYEYDAAGLDRNGLDRNGFTRDGLGSNGMLPYREPDKPATDMMSRLRREGLQGDPYLWDAPGDEDDAEEIAWPNYAERPTEEAALSNIE